MFLLCNVPQGARVRVAVGAAADGDRATAAEDRDPADAGDRDPEVPGTPLTLETLFVPPGQGAVMTMLVVSTGHYKM